MRIIVSTDFTIDSIQIFKVEKSSNKEIACPDYLGQQSSKYSKPSIYFFPISAPPPDLGEKYRPARAALTRLCSNPAWAPQLGRQTESPTLINNANGKYTLYKYIHQIFKYVQHLLGKHQW